VRSRVFNESDNDNNPQVAIINQANGANLLAYKDAVGKRFSQSNRGAPWKRVVSRRNRRKARTKSSSRSVPQIDLDVYQTGAAASRELCEEHLEPPRFLSFTLYLPTSHTLHSPQPPLSPPSPRCVFGVTMKGESTVKALDPTLPVRRTQTLKRNELASWPRDGLVFMRKNGRPLRADGVASGGSRDYGVIV